jgi:hypothetical protein
MRPGPDQCPPEAGSLWGRPFWIFGETVLEEARRREGEGEGRVIDDGHPPAQWIPGDAGGAAPQRPPESKSP